MAAESYNIVGYANGDIYSSGENLAWAVGNPHDRWISYRSLIKRQECNGNYKVASNKNRKLISADGSKYAEFTDSNIQNAFC